MMKSHFEDSCLFLILFLFAPLFTHAQFPSDTYNEIESRVIPYTLPDPLLMKNSIRVKDSIQWEKIQRPYLYNLFQENVYGKMPVVKLKAFYQLLDSTDQAFGGIAVRKQIRIYWSSGDKQNQHIDVLIYLPRYFPKNIHGPVPVFLGLNFNGNATINADTAIFIPKDNKLIRGSNASRWAVEEIVRNGLGVVTACYSDIEKDTVDGWKSGIRSTLKEQIRMNPDEWGAIGAWAWGLSQIMDYLETDKDIDAGRVAVMGHSRLGKAALWAGASDKRFSIVISNESGEGGAALARRWFGETVERINRSFPHWFYARYKIFNNDVFSLPVDQHELLALIAPRPLYVASAAGDLWSDPKGEFLSAWHAGEVYKLFGKTGLESEIMPVLNTPVGGTVRYHIRDGNHDVTVYDWTQYIAFAKDCWKMN